jgi:hypothetical protein
MGKAARRRRQAEAPARRQRVRSERGSDPTKLAEAALARLVKANPPGKVSLAGAYALGYAALAMAQIEDDEPEWFHQLDPVEMLFLGTAWPETFRDSYEFANACHAWLRLLRGTIHWKGIERFVREAVTASEEHDLPVDEGQLMLLLTGRLEAAGLDQRKLPRNLLPATLLEGSRFIFGPEEGITLPEPPSDASERVDRLWSAAQVSMPHDGTAVDALRQGLHMLGAAGLDTRSDPAALLPALYVSLVATEDEDLSEAVEHAVAWALGLGADSPLVPVTDVLLVAPSRGLDADTVLGHLFGIPAFGERVSEEGRSWHSSPGNTLLSLAFDLGYRQVITRDSKVIRMDQGTVAGMQAQFRKFEEKFGRPPGPRDPVFFDPDADEPTPLTMEGAQETTVAMLKAAGISPAWIYAYEHTDGLLPTYDGSFLSEQDQAEWDDKVEEYIELHDPDLEVDHDIETRNLQGMLVVTTLQMVAADPQYASSLAARLDTVPLPTDGDVTLLDEQLRAWEGWLTQELCSNTSVAESACEYARAWSGAQLAGRLRAAADAPDEDIPASVLLAVAVSAFPVRKTG